MVNDNDRGMGADRLPSPFSLADSFRAALLRASNYRQHLRESDLASTAPTLIVSKLRGWLLPFHAGWQRLLTPAAIDAETPGSTGGVKAGELRAALRAHRSALIGIATASGLVSLLSLTAPLFMLQVYDRVLPSRSVPTLVGLALLVLVLFAFQGLLDMLRGRSAPRRARDRRKAVATRFRARHAGAAARPRRRGRSAADPRPGQCAVVHVEHRPDRVLRSAVAAGLCCGVLSVSSPHGRCGAVRSPARLLAHVAHRSDDPRPGARRRYACDLAAETGRCRSSQRSLAAGARHAAAHDRTMDTGERELFAIAASRQRHDDRARKSFARASRRHSVGGSGHRRLSRDQPGGDRGRDAGGHDSGVAIAGASRARDRELEILRHRAAELAAAVRGPRRRAGRGRADRVARAQAEHQADGRHRGPSGHRDGRRCTRSASRSSPATRSA